MRHPPITVCFAFIAIVAGASICAPGSQAQTNKPPQKTQAEAGSTEKAPVTNYEPTNAELDCVVRMLDATTLGQAKARKDMCKDSFVLRAYYASLLVRIHAPRADDEIVRSMPHNLADRRAFYGCVDAYYAGKGAKYSKGITLGHAYEQYYKSLFRIVAERPSLLPKFFAIAARFGADPGDNLDESGWFCGALNEIYEKIPAAYMQAVGRTKNERYRENARGCALHPIP
jgi:hypothetical protein